MHRTDLMDTSPQAHKFMVERYRAMTPEERLRIVFGLIERGRQIHTLAMTRLQENLEVDHSESQR